MNKFYLYQLGDIEQFTELLHFGSHISRKETALEDRTPDRR